MMNPSPHAPGYVRWVTETLERAGYDTWAVGGAIRNTLLGIPSGDWDMATRAPPKEVQRLFPRTVPIGIEHGTVGVLTRGGVLIEVTTFRRDVETSGRHAVVEFADTLVEDLARRDFTVNALAWHPIREEFQDPFHGRQDLDERILRTVGRAQERFAEDYLRVLRGLRFSGRFGLTIEEETWKALCASIEHLSSLSPERIREELWKVLSQDPKPSGALFLYASSGVLGALYPEFAAMSSCPSPVGGGTLWDRNLLVTDLLSLSRPLLRLTALLSGVGIPDEPEIGSKGLDDQGRERAAALMIRHRYSNAQTRDVTELVGLGLDPPLHLSDPASLRRWLYRTSPGRLNSFARVWLGVSRLGRNERGADPKVTLDLIHGLRRERGAGHPLRLEELAVNGRDLIGLGLKPGPHFGQILEGLMDRVLANPSLNLRDELLRLVQMELSAPGASE